MTAGGGRPWRDRRGMATTELALVLPLLLLSAGTIEAASGRSSSYLPSARVIKPL